MYLRCFLNENSLDVPDVNKDASKRNLSVITLHESFFFVYFSVVFALIVIFLKLIYLFIYLLISILAVFIHKKIRK